MSLIPPDLLRCQAEVRPAHSFMTLGSRPKNKRCPYKPIYIATEKRPAKDGQIGAMSLCEDCVAKLIETLGVDFAHIEKIDTFNTRLK